MIESFDTRRDVRDIYTVLNEAVIDRGPSPYLSVLDLACDAEYITTLQGGDECCMTVDDIVVVVGLLAVVVGLLAVIVGLSLSCSC